MRERLDIDFFGHHLVGRVASPEVAARQHAARPGEQAAWQPVGMNWTGRIGNV
jgi:hypothetical protein